VIRVLTELAGNFIPVPAVICLSVECISQTRLIC
jgi:hypothetical protein